MRAEKRAARVRAVQQGDWRRRAPREVATAAVPPRQRGTAGARVPLEEPAFDLCVFQAHAVTHHGGGGRCAGHWFASNPAFEQARMLFTIAAAGCSYSCCCSGHKLRGKICARTRELRHSQDLSVAGLADRAGRAAYADLHSQRDFLAGLACCLNRASAFASECSRRNCLRRCARPCVLAPPFCAIQLLVPNAATILFPAWVQLVEIAPSTDRCDGAANHLYRRTGVHHRDCDRACRFRRWDRVCHRAMARGAQLQALPSPCSRCAPC